MKEPVQAASVGIEHIEEESQYRVEIASNQGETDVIQVGSVFSAKGTFGLNPERMLNWSQLEGRQSPFESK